TVLLPLLTLQATVQATLWPQPCRAPEEGKRNSHKSRWFSKLLVWIRLVDLSCKVFLDMRRLVRVESLRPRAFGPRRMVEFLKGLRWKSMGRLKN
ncbi:hypothetical protein BKA70DRAFT_1275474, partial [Coprinopsis sp. MPI-PUGE-AT-0042]